MARPRSLPCAQSLPALALLLVFALLGTGHAQQTQADKFWVFAENGVFFVDPVGQTTTQVSRDTFRDGEDYGWGEVASIHQYVVVPSLRTNRVRVFNRDDATLVADIPSCESPYHIDTAPWKDEVFVHCWYPGVNEHVGEAGDGIIHVLDAKSWGLQKELVEALQVDSLGSGHRDRGTATVVLHEGFDSNYGYTVNRPSPGLVRINLANYSTEFISLEGNGCTAEGAHLAVSPANGYAYVTCGGIGSGSPPSVFKVNPNDKSVVQLEKSAGTPVQGTAYAPHDGDKILVMSETELNIFTADDTLEVTIDESSGITGFSSMAFAEGGQGGDRVAVVTSEEENKVLLINMDNVLDRNVIGMPTPPGRGVVAGATDAGDMFAAVADQEQSKVHVLSITGTSPVNATIEYTAEGIEVSRRPTMLFVPASTPSLPVVTPSVSAHVVQSLESRVNALEESPGGLSGRFWPCQRVTQVLQ